MTATDVVGGNPAQQTLLRQILDSIGGVAISRVEIGPVPEGFSIPGDARDPVWLYYTIRADNYPQSVRATWDANIAAGLFRDRSAGSQLPTVLGKSTVSYFSDGRHEDGGSARIDQAAVGGEIVAVPRSRIGQLVREGVRSGVQLESINVSQPQNPAVVVTLRTSDPAAFVRDVNGRIQDLFGAVEAAGAPLVEGAYVQVNDADGSAFYARGYSVRLAEGVGWIRPDLIDQAPNG